MSETRYFGQDLVEAGLGGSMPPEDALGCLLGNLGPKTPVNRPDFTDARLLLGVGELIGKLVIDAELNVWRVAMRLRRAASLALRSLV